MVSDVGSGAASDVTLGLDGSDPNGPWRLWVMDDTAVGAGRFAGRWSVTVKAWVHRQGFPPKDRSPTEPRTFFYLFTVRPRGEILRASAVRGDQESP